MHVDAFFEYLRGQSHDYWSQIPTQHGPVPEERDGVPNEEDLALRALLPETRPKRGRKRAEEKEPDPREETSNVARRRRVDSHPVPEQARDPWSREPQEEHRVNAADTTKLLEARLEAWAAADSGPVTGEIQHRASEPQISMASPSEFHHDRRLTHPVYRHTARKSPNIDPFSPPTGESIDSPEAAIRPRRRTGTVVSSAWRSSGATEGSKLRGRPPTNRNMSDGPYTTFPVIPELRTSKTAPSVESPTMSSNAPTPRPELWSSAVGNWSNPNMGAGSNGPLSRKLRLPLPIPDRPVGNGSPHYQQITPPALPINTPSPNGNTPAANFGASQWTPRATLDTLRQPSIPTSYYNADGSVMNESPITNSSSAPSSRPQLELQDDINVDAIEMSYMQSVLGAEWVDNDGNPGPQPDADEAMRLVKTMIKCHQAKAGQDANAFLANVAAMAGARFLNRKLQIVRAGGNENKIFYRSCWQLQYGSVQGSMQMECWVPKLDIETRRDSLQEGTIELGDSEELEDCGRKVDWRKKYVELHQLTAKRGEKLRELKQMVLNGLLQAKDQI